MCLFSVWAVYMRVGVCRRGVYSGSDMCTAVIMWFHVRIWDFQCLSAVTDVSVDYSTGFITICTLDHDPISSAKLPEPAPLSTLDNHYG